MTSTKNQTRVAYMVTQWLTHYAKAMVLVSMGNKDIFYDQCSIFWKHLMEIVPLKNLDSFFSTFYTELSFLLFYSCLKMRKQNKFNNKIRHYLGLCDTCGNTFMSGKKLKNGSKVPQIPTDLGGFYYIWNVRWYKEGLHVK